MYSDGDFTILDTCVRIVDVLVDDSFIVNVYTLIEKIIVQPDSRTADLFL